MDGPGAERGTLCDPVLSGPTGTADGNCIRSGQTHSFDQEQVRSSPTETKGPGDPLLSSGTGTEPGVQGQQTIVDVLHARVSSGIKGTATWLDSFFGDRRYESELNRSYIRFRFDAVKEEGLDLQTPKPDVRVRIILPELRRKTRLVFSGTPRERTDFSAIGSDPENSAQDSEQQDVTAGLQQTLIDTVRKNLSVRVGARLHDGRPLVVFGPRYRVLLPGNIWQFRFIEELTWTNQEDWDSVTTIDAERKFLQDLLFRASNTWYWNDDTDVFVYAVSFGVGQPIDDIRALGYEWTNSFNTRPVHELTEVVLRVRYRQQLWRRRWMYVELTPQCRFPRYNSFRGIAGILFRLEMFLGSYR